ncbi:MAG TPA: DUF4350 domain-containing protein, partial [Phycisphaerae bacterium]|nr:DUF4350 domain-containing protein [Phycisphaerae bacterium]
CRPWRRTWPATAGFLLAALVAVLLNASSVPAVGVLAVAVLLAGLAAGRAEADRRPVLLAAQAVAVFGVYRIVMMSVPAAWALADAAGGGLGRVAGAIVGRPLSVGASFAGLDFLVLMAVLFGLWLAASPRPRLARGIVAAVGILTVHLVYLLVIACTAELIAAIPVDEVAGAARSIFDRKPWSFWAAVGSLLPWHLPALAGLVHAAVAGAMLRWSPPAPAENGGALRSLPARPVFLILGAVAVAGLAAATALYPASADLTGKKIVAYEKGFLNWLRPRHGDYGRLSIGMYGMLPDLLESFGATFARSADLSDEDLKDADALVLIFPNEPWEEGQLDRIWQFVRDGGSLLVLGEHTHVEEDGNARFNDALAPTAMRVEFDSAQWAVGGWLDCYETLAHPITAGPGNGRNRFGIVIGASVRARRPARPLILGRWGWSDHGDRGSDRAMMGNDRYDPGERLGDVCLAAEQALGKGKVIVFGDTSSLTNGIAIGDYKFLSALLAYLADPSSAPSWWRSVLAMLAGTLAIVALVLAAEPRRVGIVAAAGAVALLVCAAVTYRANVTLPDGRLKEPNNLAYIDASHLEAYSQEALRDDGTMGLELTLMRNGFLTLSLAEFDAEALKRAGLLVSIAPSRPFSAGERQAVRDFVAGGGVFLCTAGYDASEAVAPLLAEFGFRIGHPNDPDLEPPPLGHFKSPYVTVDGRMHHVRFHAAWPVAEDPSGLIQPPDSQAGEIQVYAYGREDMPVILGRRYGNGRVIVVGDTGFAMNKNLEHVDGSPFEGIRENADFWRWFLPQVTGRPRWTPPGPEEVAPKGGPSAAEETP